MVGCRGCLEINDVVDRFAPHSEVAPTPQLSSSDNCFSTPRYTRDNTQTLMLPDQLIKIMPPYYKGIHVTTYLIQK